MKDKTMTIILKDVEQNVPAYVILGEEKNPIAVVKTGDKFDERVIDAIGEEYDSNDVHYHSLSQERYGRYSMNIWIGDDYKESFELIPVVIY